MKSVNRMKTITICSSIRNTESVRSTLREMEICGIRGLFPNIDFQAEGSELSLNEMKKLQDDHFKAIASSDAVYVINPNGYIGTMVSVEIGYATGQEKAVYFSEESSKIELDALATGIISTDNIQEFKKV